MGNDHVYWMLGICTIYIKMHDGMIRELTDCFEEPYLNWCFES